MSIRFCLIVVLNVCTPTLPGALHFETARGNCGAPKSPKDESPQTLSITLDGTAIHALPSTVSENIIENTPSARRYSERSKWSNRAHLSE